MGNMNWQRIYDLGPMLQNFFCQQFTNFRNFQPGLIFADNAGTLSETCCSQVGTDLINKY